MTSLIFDATSASNHEGACIDRARVACSTTAQVQAVALMRDWDCTPLKDAALAILQKHLLKSSHPQTTTKKISKLSNTRQGLTLPLHRKGRHTRIPCATAYRCKKLNSPFSSTKGCIPVFLPPASSVRKHVSISALAASGVSVLSIQNFAFKGCM